MEKGRIITIGLSPAWDVRCRGRGLDWGRHAEIDEQSVRPAGKALNVSYALAWLGCRSIAAGLWGREDYGRMQQAVRGEGEWIDAVMTLVDGRTRQNITVVDTLHRREMHLRRKSELASERSLRRLNTHLEKLVRSGDTCVFAGAMSNGEFLDQVVGLVATCRQNDARVMVDTHSAALKGIVDAGLPSLIAPNVEELRGLLGARIEDTPARLAEACRTLLERMDAVLVSRGQKGALIVTKAGAWTAHAGTKGEVLSTVGCGDYLLAGFLASWRESGDPRAAVEQAVKVATARAWGWTEGRHRPQTDKEIPVNVAPVSMKQQA